MPKNHFLDIFWMLHIPSESGPVLSRVDKIQPLLHHFVSSFQSQLFPCPNVSVDETIVGFKIIVYYYYAFIVTLYVYIAWIFRTRPFQFWVGLMVSTCDNGWYFTLSCVLCIRSDSVIICYDGDELGTATYVSGFEKRAHFAH